MSLKKVKTLLEMNRGEKGQIVSVNGGGGLINRLADIGVRQGKYLTKISTQPMNGPIQVRIENFQIAIGQGMANKIIVECET